MSVLVPKIQKLVHNEQDNIIREQITPWIMGFASNKWHVKDFYGKQISFEGCAYEGSPCSVFWGKYIDPFLENAIDRLSTQIVFEAEQNKLDFEDEMKSLQMLLKALISRIYNEMAKAEQSMQGKGYPEKVPKRDVQAYVDSTNLFLEAVIEMEIKKRCSKTKEEKKNFLLKGISKAWTDPVGSKLIAGGIGAGMMWGVSNVGHICEQISAFFHNGAFAFSNYINTLGQ